MCFQTNRPRTERIEVMLVIPEWLFAVLSLVAVFLGLGLCLGLGFVACVWKPEHVYATLLRGASVPRAPPARRYGVCLVGGVTNTGQGCPPLYPCGGVSMIRWLLCGLALCMTGELAAQTYVENPVMRRVRREKAVEYVGTQARAFVESPLGDVAAAALLSLSPPAAMKLVAFYNTGQLYQLPQPGNLLLVIYQEHSDDVALWAIAHTKELSDPDNMDAYLASPREYTLNLKYMIATTPEARKAKDRKMLLFSGAAVIGVGLIVWWRRRRAV